MAIAINVADRYSDIRNTPITVRTSGGIVYSVLADRASNNVEVYKANAVTPTSFSSVGTYTSITDIFSVSVAIDASDILHISWVDVINKAPALKYITFDTSNDTFGTVDTAITDTGISDGTQSASIYLDGNDDVHIAFTYGLSVMGTSSIGPAYVNFVGGVWSTPVYFNTIQDGVVSTINMLFDSGNVPHIVYHQTHGPGGTDDVYIGLQKGNATDATSFTEHTITLTGGIYSFVSEWVIDANDDIYLWMHETTTNDDWGFRKHTAADGWTTWAAWQSSLIGSTIDDNTAIFLASDGNIHFYHNDSNNTHLIIYDIVNDRFYDEGLQFSFVYDDWKISKEYDGTNYDISYATNLVDNFWEALAHQLRYIPTIVPNTADAHDFGADDTPTLEFTGSDANSDDLEYQIQFSTVSSFEKTHQLRLFGQDTSKTSDSITYQGSNFPWLGENNEDLVSIAMWLSGTSITAVGKVEIYATSGGLGTGSPIYSSDSVDLSGLTGTLSAIIFPFSEEVVLVKNTLYAYVLSINNTDSISFWGVATGGYGTSVTAGTWTNDTNFAPLVSIRGEDKFLDKLSSLPEDTFTNTTDGADTHPFNAGDKADYTVQVGDALAYNTYYWRARAIDPLDRNVWSEWTTIRRFDVVEPVGAMLGTINGAATTSGILNAKGSLVGSIDPTITTEGNLTIELTIAPITGTIDGVATTSGLAHADAKGFGVSNGVASTEGILLGLSHIEGSIDITITNNGILTAKGILTGHIDTNATGSTGLRDSNSFLGQSTSIALNGFQYFSQSFHGWNGDISAIKILITQTIGTIGSDLGYIKIYAHSGTFGTSSVPTGAALGTSTGINLSSLQGQTDQIVQFDFPTNFNVVEGTDYVFVVEHSTNGSGDFLVLGLSANVHEGNYASTGWTPDVNKDILFEINGLLDGSTGVTVEGILSTLPVQITGTINGTATTEGILYSHVAIFGESNSATTTVGVLLGLGQILGIVDVTVSTEGILRGIANLEGSSDGVADTLSDLSGSSTDPIFGESNGIATINGILIASGVLIGASNPALTITGTLQARGDLESSIDGVAALTGIMIADGELIGSSEGSVITSGLLNSNLKGSVIVNSTTDTFGVLTADGELIGTSNGVATETANLTSKAFIDGTINGLATTQGVLIAKGELQGIINGVTTITSDLTSNSVSGTITTLSTVDGILTAKGELASSITPVVLTFGILTSDGKLEGTINGVATVQGDGTLYKFLVSSIDANATTSGTLTADGLLSVISDGIATVSGALTSDVQAIGVVTTATTTTGVMLAIKQLVGETNGIATVSAGILACQVGGTTFEKPVSDVAVGSWTTSPLWSDIDDGQAEDNVLITSDAVGNGVNTTNADGTFDTTTDPLESTGHIIRAKWLSDNASRNIDGYFELWQGVPGTGTLIATCTLAAITNTEVLTEYTLTGTEADNITDYTDLHWRLYGIGAGGGTARSLQVDFIEFEVPGAKSVLTVGIIIGQATVTGTLINTTANSQIVGEINGVATVSGVLVAQGELASIINTNTTTISVLSGKGLLEGSSEVSVVVDGLLTNGITIGTLSGIINTFSTVSVTLSAINNTEGIINGTATTSSLLGAIVQISGASNGLATMFANMISDAAFGITSGQATVSAQLVGKGGTPAIVNGATTVSATLTGIGVSEVIVIGATTTTGTLLAKGTLNGVINAIATTQGILISDAVLVLGTINSSTILSGVLIGKGLLSSISDAIATTNGSMTSIGSLVGSVNGIATTQSILVANGSLTGNISGQTSTEGILTSDAMAGITNGTATTQGILSAKGSLVGEINGVATTLITAYDTTPIKGVTNGFAYVEGTLGWSPLIKGEINGKATVTGILTGINQIDSSCFHIVQYIDKEYHVHYKTKIYVVNYKCKKH